jgi:hypothetical protein
MRRPPETKPEPEADPGVGGKRLQQSPDTAFFQNLNFFGCAGLRTCLQEPPRRLATAPATAAARKTAASAPAPLTQAALPAQKVGIGHVDPLIGTDPHDSPTNWREPAEVELPGGTIGWPYPGTWPTRGQAEYPGSSRPENAKSCEPEGPQDLTQRLFHPQAGRVKRERIGSVRRAS